MINNFCRNFLYVLAIYVIYACAVLRAEVAQLPFYRFDFNHEFSQNSIISILKSQDGYIWLGTQYGLNRFDGYQFKVFRHEPDDPKSLTGNIIRSLVQDSKGFIWIATRNGLSRFDPGTESFINYQHNPSDPTSLSSNNLSEVFIDSKDQLWVGTWNNGLSRFNASTKSFIHFIHESDDPTSISSNAVRAIVEDDHGNFWIGTRNTNSNQPFSGLNRFDVNSEKFHRIKRGDSRSFEADFTSVLSLYFDSEKTLWIGTNRHGLNRLDTKSEHFYLVLDKNDPNTNYSDIRPEAIIQADNNGLWIGVHTYGLLYFDKTEESFTSYPYSPENPLSPSGRTVVSLLQDESQLWVGTWRGGINKLNLSSRQFSWITHNPMDSDSIPKKTSFVGMVNDSKQNLWIAASKTGLIYWDSSTNKSKIMTHILENGENGENLVSQRVNSVYIDSQQQLWVGTYENGLYRVNLQTKQFQHYNYSKNGSNEIEVNRIVDIIEEPAGILWIAVRGHGLDRLDIKSNQFTHYSPTRDKNHRIISRSFNANSMFIDKDKNLWIGTNDSGAIRLNTISGKITNYSYQRNEPSISSNYVTGFVQDSQGNIWISTGKGLNKINWLDGQANFSHFNSLSHGLKYNFLESLQIDKNGIIWISHRSSVARFDPVNETLVNYGIFDGSKPGNFLDGSSTINKAGHLFFGGGEGLLHFDPLTISRPVTTPKVILTGFFLNNRPVEVSQEKDSLLHKVIQKMASLELSYKQSNFGFSFSGVDYQNPDSIQYAYRMSGFNKDWIETESDNRRATYTNLDAGKYQFQVKANTNGIWSSQVKQIDIIILPPPWRTWWAYMIYFTVLTSIISSLLWQRYKIVLSIKQRALAIEQRNKQLSLTSKLFENTSEGVWLLDNNFHYLAVNSGFEAITGHKKKDVVGKKIRFATVKNQVPNFMDAAFERVKESKRWSEQIWDIRKNGEIYPLEIVVDKVDIEDQNGNIIDIHYVGIFSDITQRRRAEEELRHMAYYDSLTELPNRAQFQTLVQATIDRATDVLQSEFILLFIDLDNFKNINDSLGHSPGDEMLVIMAKKLRAFVKPPITVARLGGDEFSILLPPQAIGYKIAQFATDFTNQLMNVIRNDIELEGYNFKMTASIGIVIYPHDGLTYEELLRNADTAMYHAKNSGRNDCKFYSEEMNQKARLRLDYESELSKAIVRNELKPFFQPKANLQTGEIVGAEVLARWNNKKHGWIRPDQFIPLAEETGHILDISDYLLRQACKIILPIIKQNLFKGRMAFNLSAAQFTDPDFSKRIYSILQECNFPIEYLELEVTESLMMTDVVRAIELMKEFRQRGIHLALDDFGTGYSSLSYLKRFPLDILKIDRSFIIDIVDVEESRNIVSSITQLSHDLNMRVVAEGAEDQEQIQLLREMGCDLVQGYYLSKPMAGEEYLKFLRIKSNLYSVET